MQLVGMRLGRLTRLPKEKAHLVGLRGKIIPTKMERSFFNRENEDFVDSVAYSLAEAWVFYKDTKPFAIYKNDNMIGFVSMYIGEENYQIINFLIDDAFQKKGFGTKAAKVCISLEHFAVFSPI